MSKRICLLFTFLLVGFLVNAQDFEIVSVEHLPNDFAARKEIKTDPEGRLCALLRIATRNITPEQREGFGFMPDQGAYLVERSFRDGEIWLWVSPKLKHLRVKHRAWGQVELHMQDYVSIVESLHVYKIIVKGSVDIFETKRWDTKVIRNDVDVRYYSKKKTFFGYEDVYAEVNGLEYKIDLSFIGDSPCLAILAQDDFDGDGVKDALVEDIQACGGNAVGNSFFFISYAEDGYFSVSNTFGENVNQEPLIEVWSGRKTVVILDNGLGKNHGVKKERYALEHGQAELVESMSKQSLSVLKEVNASDFHNGDEETRKLSYDLDENGIMDYIECSYWDRWDLVEINGMVLNGKIVEWAESPNGFRIGILSTKTNGMHDLVFHDNDVWKWDGKKYVQQK